MNKIYYQSTNSEPICKTCIFNSKYGCSIKTINSTSKYPIACEDYKNKKTNK